jgi:hypothetical protein
MHASTILYGLVFLQGAMATPVGAAGSGIEPRGGKPQALEARAIEPRVPALGDIPFPLFPTKKPSKLIVKRLSAYQADMNFTLQRKAAAAPIARLAVGTSRTSSALLEPRSVAALMATVVGDLIALDRTEGLKFCRSTLREHKLL